MTKGQGQKPHHEYRKIERHRLEREAEQVNRRNDRDKCRKFYFTDRWRALCGAQLLKQPYCCVCLKHGVKKYATVSAHVAPHRGNAVLFWSGPFKSLCAGCYANPTQVHSGKGACMKKAPHEIKSHFVRWAQAKGDPLVRSDWILPAGIIKQDASFEPDGVTTVLISGGEAGRNYSLTNRVRTSRGRVYDRTITLRVTA
jgi:5-methylcytosine-specific restriction enzyme A